MKSETPYVDQGRSTAAVNGYDLVAYFATGEPARGNGHHVAVVDGVTYLFGSEENKKAFEAQPERYLPAYGGYCAYGVSLGKKFVGDPEVWKIVDGKLYFALNRDIQCHWAQDIPGHIRHANANWKKIRDTAPAQL